MNLSTIPLHIGWYEVVLTFQEVHKHLTSSEITDLPHDQISEPQALQRMGQLHGTAMYKFYLQSDLASRRPWAILSCSLGIQEHSVCFVYCEAAP